uniref:protein NUCLEAR FUSION DEFECTIVE 6, mitochondrial-like isoform X3 n=1 Tax=Erigeron canadensis TaxID=72917 RepID=UPI001CB8DE98|nr:protein NUCLEAR FUSION DEFECTIVE 6, mitochondrial-like isoform X3 [Erigeron canadensis]XP_043625050.1 protein NUCLEAR FUSION DEFECTIVE 6, mitochondrial-like isoform X3 [Erigeron canadensis]
MYFSSNIHIKMAARSAFRSFNTVRSAASRISTAAPKPNVTSASRSAFRIPSQKNPLSHRIFRSPVELSAVSVESMLPFHTATASALLTSMLSAAPRTCGWTLEDLNDDL